MLNATGPMEKKNGCSCRRRFAARIGLGGTAFDASIRFIRRYIRCVPLYAGRGFGPCQPDKTGSYSDALRANNYFSGSQFGTTSAGVSNNLLSGRYDWLASQHAQPRLVTTYTNRSMGGTDAIACLPPHKLLDQSILQRMKSDNYHSPTYVTSTTHVIYPPRTQHIQYLREHCLQPLQFMIDSNAQSLEGLCRRMYCPCSIRDTSSSQSCQLRRARNRSLCSLTYDTSCNLARTALFAVTPENVCQFVFTRAIHQVSGGKCLRLIEPHIERPIDAERESTLWITHLVR